MKTVKKNKIPSSSITRPSKMKRQKPKTSNKSTNQQHRSKNSNKKNKKRPPSRKKVKGKHLKQLCLELTFSLLVFGGLFFVIQFFVFSMPKVNGYSMVTTLSDGERVFVNKLGEIKRFELVYYKNPSTNERSIQRVIGLPGEEIQYKADELFINSNKMEERFLTDKLNKVKESDTFFTQDFHLQQITGSHVIPKGKYIVLGDNRPYAVDSRAFGYLDEKDIVGVVEMRLLPLHRIQKF